MTHPVERDFPTHHRGRADGAQSFADHRGIILKARDWMLLAILALHFIFNYGFMIIRIPPTPGGGIPITEVALILALSTLRYPAEFRRLATVIPLVPLLSWWAWGLARSALDYLEHGLWALRDAVHVIESLFLLIGFACAGNIVFRSIFFKWLVVVLGIVTLFSLSAPLQSEIQDFSPTILNAAGRHEPIFGHIGGAYICVLTFTSYILIRYTDDFVLLAIMLVILSICLLMFQARIFYFLSLFVFLFCGILYPATRRYAVLFILLLLFLLALIEILDFQIVGNKGGVAGLNPLYEHALSTFGYEGRETSLAFYQAQGSELRLAWWSEIIRSLFEHPLHLVFGKGFGFELTSLIHKGSLIREPHNSFISILARLGLIGFLLFFWLHFYLVKAWLQAYTWSRSLQLGHLHIYLVCMMVFFIGTLVTSLGQDALEKPYLIVPYYFLWGVVLRIAAAAARERRLHVPE